MKKAAIFHTTAMTIAPLQALAKEIMPEAEIINLAEDGMIRDVIRHGGPTAAISARVANYMLCAEKAGCEVFMTACSSIGEVVESCQMLTTMKVTRIDLAMAEKAVELGSKIAILATAATTMKPTSNLIARKAVEVGKQVEIKPYLMPEAYAALMAGDTATHDQMVKRALITAAAENQVVVLAQASMARVLAGMGSIAVPVLTSPELGMRHLRQLVEGN
jgi:hypothetical protein